MEDLTKDYTSTLKNASWNLPSNIRIEVLEHRINCLISDLLSSWINPNDLDEKLPIIWFHKVSKGGVMTILIRDDEEDYKQQGPKFIENELKGELEEMFKEKAVKVTDFSVTQIRCSSVYNPNPYNRKWAFIVKFQIDLNDKITIKGGDCDEASRAQLSLLMKIFDK